MLSRIYTAGINLTLIGFLRPQLASRYFRAASRGLSQIARRRGLSVVLVGLLTLGINAGVSLLVHMPEPRDEDEFSYLLAADTFAHGRLTNPTHPMWVHFESFHIIHQPTYQSKYPPAQGLILGAGQVIGGHPIVGVWISIGLMGAAMCWMLQAWLPPRWALLGGLVVALHPGILLKWGDGYWGGAVAAIGGALVFGALRRIVLRPRMRDALLMGLGLAILANSRPYEGLIASLPVAVALLVWMISKNGPAFRVSLTRVLLPIFVMLVATAAWIGYYNLRVTGDALRMPYLVHHATYQMWPLFLWQEPGPEPAYRHKVLRDFYVDYMRNVYVEPRSVPSFLRKSVERIQRLWKFYLGYLLTVPLITLPWVLRNRWMVFALLTCGLVVGALQVHTYLNVYHQAPITALVFALLLQAMRHLNVWQWRGRPTGRFVVRAILLIFVASLVLSLAQKVRVKSEHEWSQQRGRILAQLEQDGRRHLVIVRYGPKFSKFSRSKEEEWVYNEADIDRAKVVWAREMNAGQDRKLLDYFKDRQAWLLEVNGDQPPVKLLPHPARLTS
jgi:hypothetical protein